MINPLHFRGNASGVTRRTLGRLTFTPAPKNVRGDCFLAIVEPNITLDPVNLEGHAAILVDRINADKVSKLCSAQVTLDRDQLLGLAEGSVLAVNTDGQTSVLFNPLSSNNSIFATGRCNCDCIMCPQPPVTSEPDDLVVEHLRLIDLIEDAPQCIGITGGEPTLLKDGIVLILERLKNKFEEAHVHLLTNGRMYAYPDFANRIAAVNHPHLLSAIPLYADNAADHDWIMQVQGAFDQTVKGLYNAAERGLEVEIRVVLHKQTLPRLEMLAEFVYRNFPFVNHVAFMGLENMGYVKRNWELLWTDPIDYADVLEKAVRHLFLRQMNVSIYNLQLCVLPRPLWPFARKSISDFKNTFLDACTECEVRDICGGLFISSVARRSRGIRPLQGDSHLTEEEIG